VQRRCWAEDGHLLVGVALTAWIVVQIAILGWPPAALQLLYLAYGLVVTGLAIHLRRPPR